MRKMLLAVLMVLAVLLCSTVMGATYLDGVNAYIAKDFSKAVQIFKELAEKGGALSQFFLGSMYEEGKGVPQDFKEAVKWYRRAAEQGDACGQRSLGLMYAGGKGVPQDMAEAYFWLNLSAARYFESEKGRDEASSQLAPAKREEVQNRCRKWLENFEKRKKSPEN